MNLYVHFPFCRRKCTYCALHSRVGISPERRADYVNRLVEAVSPSKFPGSTEQPFSTVYFGGGSPALCDLGPFLNALAPRITPETEFTVELHPHDVSKELLTTLKAGGVNRISMGLQSLDDAVLAHMGRCYTLDEAKRAFLSIKEYFNNAGIDLIVGYPGDTPPQAAGDTPLQAAGDTPLQTAGDTPPKAEASSTSSSLEALNDWGIVHCSIYSLIFENKSILYSKIKHKKENLTLPDDNIVLDQIRKMSHFLQRKGFLRYEISNYALPGYECRHNLAVWRGEDYIGLGEGAHGRIGLTRTRNAWGVSPQNWGVSPQNFWGHSPEIETVSEEFDAKERAIFRLRTSDGIDASNHEQWRTILERYSDEGFVEKSGSVYKLTERGREVCDALLVELI